MGSMGAMNVGGVNVQGLVQRWINALTKPNVATYEAEIPNANWTPVIIAVATVTIFNVVFRLLSALIFTSATNPFSSLGSQFGNSSSNANVSNLMSTLGGGIGVGGALLAIITTPIAFFLGAGILWLSARIFGGTGSNFMTHSYLLSVSYAPTRIIAAVLSFIPVLGLIGGLLSLYQLYLAGLSMQASQRMQPGKAQAAAFVPLAVLILLYCVCIIAFIGIIAAALNGSSN
jgi:hypothetical protein